MKTLRSLAILRHFPLAVRLLGLWAASLLCVAFSPNTSQVIVQNDRTLEIRRPSIDAANQVEMIGVWPYGPCEASAIDTSRNISLIGNGETLQVLDISNPSSPSQIGELRIEGSAKGIVLGGNYAYVVTLNYFIIVDLTDPGNPRKTASVFFPGQLFRSARLSANSVFLASVQGLFIYDVSNPHQPVFRTHYTHDNINIIDVALWNGYALCLGQYWKPPENQDLRYCLEVVDTSNPASPFLVGTFDLGKDYVLREVDVSSAGQAYVCQSTERNEAGRLLVIDIATDPAHPSEIGRYVKPDNGLERIALSGRYAYLLESWPRRLAILDIFNPQSPVLVGECETDGSGDMVSSGNLVGISLGGSGFSLYSVANPADPFRLANVDTPDTVRGRGNNIAARGNSVYLACNTDGLRIMDVSDPASPLEAGVFSDMRLERALAVSGKYAYGLDSQRLSIVDVSLPQSPTRAGNLALPCPDPGSDFYDYSGIAVRAPYAYVSGTNWDGNPQRALLWIIDVSDPFAPRLVSSFVCANNAQCIGAPALSGGYLYLGVHDFSQGEDDCRAGLRVIDVRDPGKPKEVYAGISSLPGFGVNVAVRENRAYLTGDLLRIFDLSNPAFPGLLATYALYSEGIAFSGDFAYLNSDKLWVVDISDINNPTGVFYRGESGKGVAVTGNLAFVPGSLSILKNTLAPDVSLSSPSGSSTLLGSVLIEARADHASGIDRVEFYIDDIWKVSDASAPYTYTWDTTSAEDGLHSIRARAYNANGKSADAEREAFTRLVYAPLSFAGERVRNGLMSPFDFLSWQAHPDNVNIIKYRLFRVEEGKRILLAELNADTFRYRNMRFVSSKPTTYALIAVNDANRESDPVTVIVP